MLDLFFASLLQYVKKKKQKKNLLAKNGLGLFVQFAAFNVNRLHEIKIYTHASVYIYLQLSSQF